MMGLADAMCFSFLSGVNSALCGDCPPWLVGTSLCLSIRKIEVEGTMRVQVSLTFLCSQGG